MGVVSVRNAWSLLELRIASEAQRGKSKFEGLLLPAIRAVSKSADLPRQSRHLRGSLWICDHAGPNGGGAEAGVLCKLCKPNWRSMAKVWATAPLSPHCQAVDLPLFRGWQLGSAWLKPLAANGSLTGTSPSDALDPVHSSKSTN